MRVDTIKQAAEAIEALTCCGGVIVEQRAACGARYCHNGETRVTWQAMCHWDQHDSRNFSCEASTLQALVDSVELRVLRREADSLRKQLADALAAAASHGATQIAPPDPTGRGVDAEAPEVAEQPVEEVLRTAHFCNACGLDRPVRSYPGGAVLCEECARYVNPR